MINKYIFRALFCLFRYLPSSQNIIFGRLSKSLRAFTAKGFIKKCGKNVNIEHGAEISSKLSIGDNSGVGIDVYFFQDSINLIIPMYLCARKDLQIRSRL